MRPIFFLFPLFLLACEKDRYHVKSGVPDCVRQEIENPPVEPYLAVYRYRIDGQDVYNFVRKCCDFGGITIDDRCQTFCIEPGFVVEIDSTTACPDFPDERELVWEQE